MRLLSYGLALSSASTVLADGSIHTLGLKIYPNSHPVQISLNESCILGGEDGLLFAAGNSLNGICFPDPPLKPTKRPAPWTQELCEPSHDSLGKYCIYTDTNFASGRGISIFTSPEVAEIIANSDPFLKPETIADVNIIPSPSFSKEALPGRGFGLIANRTLYRGDLIFAYTPAYIAAEDVYVNLPKSKRHSMQREAIDALPPYTRDMVWGLHAHFDIERTDSIINTNSFEVEFGEGKTHYAVFPETARINHDCRPNAHYHFDPKTLTSYVHAIRTIRPGEELSVSYTDLSVTHEERRAYIKNSWGFDCTCSHCTRRDVFINESDKRLLKIDELEAHLNDWTFSSSATPEMAETLVALYTLERLDSPISEAYTHAALQYNAVGKESQAVKYAALACEYGMLHNGADADDVLEMQDMMADPKGHWSWRLRHKVLEQHGDMRATEDIIAEAREGVMRGIDPVILANAERE
jgi:hypothetical protein